jgi:hypothetical protein
LGGDTCGGGTQKQQQPWKIERVRDDGGGIWNQRLPWKVSGDLPSLMASSLRQQEKKLKQQIGGEKR